ncbi:hypothetical protein IAR50_002397 [Cryptococcus sp. DSM 104548]
MSIPAQQRTRCLLLASTATSFTLGYLLARTKQHSVSSPPISSQETPMKPGLSGVRGEEFNRKLQEERMLPAKACEEQYTAETLVLYLGGM